MRTIPKNQVFFTRCGQLYSKKYMIVVSSTLKNTWLWLAYSKTNSLWISLLLCGPEGSELWGWCTAGVWSYWTGCGLPPQSQTPAPRGPSWWETDQLPGPGSLRTGGNEKLSILGHSEQARRPIKCAFLSLSHMCIIKNFHTCGTVTTYILQTTVARV